MSNSEPKELKYSHSHISIFYLNKKFYGISLKDKDDKRWESFLNKTLEYSSEHNCWIVNNKSLRDFTKLVDNHEETDSESSSSTDDELIQKTLCRRLTIQKSKQSLIDEHNVSDSEMEDVVSLTRRIRYLLKKVSQLEERVLNLENSDYKN
jgi:hypothetical protein